MIAATCRSCHAPIYWALTEQGKRIPLNPPDPAGNLAVHRAEDGTLHARSLIPPDPWRRPPDPWRPDTALRYGEKRAASHFATCPYAADHRTVKP